jgi:hypothetical protein
LGVGDFFETGEHGCFYAWSFGISLGKTGFVVFGDEEKEWMNSKS